MQDNSDNGKEILKNEELKVERLMQLDRVVDSGKLTKEEIDFCNKNYLIGLEDTHKCITDVAILMAVTLLIATLGFFLGGSLGTLMILTGMVGLFGGCIWIGTKYKRGQDRILKRLNEIYSKVNEKVEIIT